MKDAIIIDDPHYVSPEQYLTARDKLDGLERKGPVPSYGEDVKPAITPMRKGRFHMKSKSVARSRKSRQRMQKVARRRNR